ncbi:MAG: hypothetical protein GX937_06840 [Lentisphaerae bacterium]|jgi:neutral ceramidase|nr:hypothetical protein [Lentisphaerota bacterium]
MQDLVLKAGFGRTDITPALGTYLTGYGDHDRPAEKVLDPLHATAIVLEQGGKRAAIVALDWCFVCEQHTNTIRQAITEKTGLNPEHIQLSCSHTHSAPHTRLRKTISGGVSHIENGRAYVVSVIPKIVEAVQLACDSLTACKVGFAQTESSTGVSRRAVHVDGAVSFEGGPNDVFDSTMTVVHFKDAATGDNRGIIVHYGAHNTALGATREVSRDWCGIMKDRIESQFKAPVLFLNGSEGDTGPRTNVVRPSGRLNAGGGDGIESAREVGYRAATDAIRALVSIREFRPALPLSVQTFDLDLPYQKLPTTEEALEMRKTEGIMRDYADMVLAIADQPVRTALNFRMTIIALGPLAILPLPGEVFSSISLRLRGASPFQHTLVCSQSNGTNAYITDREGVARGGYEIKTRLRFGPYIFVDDIDDVIVKNGSDFLAQIEKEHGAG